MLFRGAKRREIPDIPTGSNHLRHELTASPLNPIGLKGVGEAGCIPTGAAFAQALEDALADYKIEITEIPLSPDRLFALLQRTTPERRNLVVIDELMMRLGQVEEKLAELKQSQGEPVGYVRDYALRFMHENNRATQHKRATVGRQRYSTLHLSQNYSEGWQLVPIEPTSEMILAAVKGQSNRTTVPRDDELAAGMYYDMLAAAPKLGDKE